MVKTVDKNLELKTSSLSPNFVKNCFNVFKQMCKEKTSKFK